MEKQSENSWCCKCRKTTTWSTRGKALRCGGCGTEFPCSGPCGHWDCLEAKGLAAADEHGVLRLVGAGVEAAGGTSPAPGAGGGEPGPSGKELGGVVEEESEGAVGSESVAAPPLAAEAIAVDKRNKDALNLLSPTTPETRTDDAEATRSADLGPAR
jgi:hypothetical protein